MKQLLRIILGIIYSPVVFFFGTWRHTRWSDNIWLSMWYLVSGQWDKLKNETIIKNK